MKHIYYGWTNLIVAALAMVATLPGRTQGLGLIRSGDVENLNAQPSDLTVWEALKSSAFWIFALLRRDLLWARRRRCRARHRFVAGGPSATTGADVRA